jgi:DNA repair photolyase
MDITEIKTKTALVKSKIPGVDYVINPYLGCGHGCKYCYAGFMTKYSHHHAGSRWGDFVEIKVNIADVLRSELARKRKKGSASLSSVCDPYQPVECERRLTRKCVENLLEFGWEVNVLTRSPLVARDIDLLSSAPSVSVGISIPTDSDDVRKILEPNAPSILSRVEALRRLHGAGIRSWAFIGPMLPMNPKALFEMVSPYVDHVLIDALNYRKQVSGIFLRNGWEYELTDQYAMETEAELAQLFGEKRRRA